MRSPRRSVDLWRPNLRSAHDHRPRSRRDGAKHAVVVSAIAIVSVAAVTLAFAILAHETPFSPGASHTTSTVASTGSSPSSGLDTCSAPPTRSLRGSQGQFERALRKHEHID